MAIKMDRQIDAVEIGYFVNAATEKGKVVVASTAGSGIALESPENVAAVSASSSGTKPLGILLNEFVDVDLTRQPINFHKDQSQIGSKATILTKGWVVTDQVVGSPNAGDKAILHSSGVVSGLAPGAAWNQAANPEVGRFRSKKNEDGFAKVYVDL